MEINGYKAKIEYDFELDQFQGEILGLNGSADFYGKSSSVLRKEFRNSLRKAVHGAVIFLVIRALAMFDHHGSTPRA